uniref:Chlorosome envelope protein B n=1 Tax=Chlorobium chlorochromatii (strain CaD3) TaxID=340177 RepID=Q3APN0_CHLCH
MAENNTNPIAEVVTSVMQTVSTVAQQPVNLLNTGLTTAQQVAEPLFGAVTGLLSNVRDICCTVSQALIDALTPKK